MKLSQFIDKSVWAEDLEVGTIRDVVVDSAEWKVTHYEVQLKKSQQRNSWS